MAHKKLYLVSGINRRAAGRHNWFGPVWFGGYRGFSTFIATRSLRHANAQYRRLKPAERQMDMRSNRKAVVLKYGKIK